MDARPPLMGTHDSSPAAAALPLEAPSAWSAHRLGDLGVLDDDTVLGGLSRRWSKAGFRSLESKQVDAWRAQLIILRETAKELIAADPAAANWTIALEFEIPRRGRRLDAVLVAPHMIMVLEFKIGAGTYLRHDLWQAQDYRLDLADFHEASRSVRIESVLIASEATAPTADDAMDRSTGVWRGNAASAPALIRELCVTRGVPTHPPIDAAAWLRAGYRPTPTILEAARRIFAGHDVRELSHAYADNLTATTDVIHRVIESARAGGRRVLCFVTGVPGAGKTLAGLTAMQDARNDPGRDGRASFMSGNGPLVKVIREALVRDRRAKGASRAAAAREVEVLVQNVHRFIEHHGIKRPDSTPPDHVIAFDEAQRAWHAEKVGKRHDAQGRSEPDLVLEIMGRTPGWAVVVALVGGGQEIHDGEAGIEAWGRAVLAASEPWDVVVSPEVLEGGTSVAGGRLFAGATPAEVRVRTEAALHLSVSVRSPRAQQLAEWVNRVMDQDAEGARRMLNLDGGFRLLLTRELDDARAWLRQAGTGRLRSGLLASSGGLRLRAYGLEVDANFRKGFPFSRWFLDHRDDHRSSHRLEVAATDFECQGLELDYTGVCWAGDLTVDAGGVGWSCRTLRGARWQRMKDAQKRQYLVNKYRVLLTRAREGMVIWVPRGEAADPTLDPEPLDRTAALLEAAGATVLASSCARSGPSEPRTGRE